MNRTEEPSDETKARTPAYANFDSSTDKILYVFHVVVHGALIFKDDFETKATKLREKIDDFETKLTKLREIISRRTNEAKEVGNLPGKEASKQEIRDTQTLELVNSLQRLLDILIKPGSQEFKDGLQTILGWIPVLTVSSVEAYLEDALIYAAKLDPAIMESSRPRPKVSYAKVARARSLEELKDGLKEVLSPQWAKNFMNDGGPAKWINKLTKMGARGYTPETAKEMETLWEVRHLIVHSSGVATPEFVRRHPEIDAKVGERILIPTKQIFAWIEVVFHFVDVTDSYFVQRYRLGTVSTT
jgi:hypothetical protein